MALLSTKCMDESVKCQLVFNKAKNPTESGPVDDTRLAAAPPYARASKVVCNSLDVQSANALTNGRARYGGLLTDLTSLHKLSARLVDEGSWVSVVRLRTSRKVDGMR